MGVIIVQSLTATVLEKAHLILLGGGGWGVGAGGWGVGEAVSRNALMISLTHYAIIVRKEKKSIFIFH